MDSRHYWDENGGSVKYENYSSSEGYCRQADGNLNFATGALGCEDDGDFISNAYLKKGKVPRQQDPMSHRIIEKRRRDRMNNCLADLSRLIPADYCKKGHGRVEKTEIIEMAIRHLKYLQERSNVAEQNQEGPISLQHFRLGYQECSSEVMRYLVETQGYLPTDSLCVHLVGHLNKHCDNIMKGDQLNQPRSNPETTSSSSGSSGRFGDKISVISQGHRSENSNHGCRKRHYDSTPSAPSPDIHEDYINLPYYIEDDAPMPQMRERVEPPPPTLRSVRKVDRDEYTEHAHNYKFKNTIQKRFSQDCDEAHDMTLAKRRWPVKQDSNASAATSLTSSNDEGVCRDASPEPHVDESPDSLYVPAAPSLAPALHTALRIPVFALNGPGKYYVPLNVSYESLAEFVGPFDLLNGRGSDGAAPLHSVCINVNFQPYSQRVKSEPESDGPKWRPA